MKKKIMQLIFILTLTSTLFILTGCGKNKQEESTDSSKNQEVEENESKNISKDDSYIGYYADIDADGTVDGVIYADLLIGGSGEWGTNGYGTYTISTIENAKEYYIIQEDYEGDFGIADVLAVDSESSGDDRFYVMSLKDFNSSLYYWYYLGNYHLSSKDNVLETDNDFGTGKEKTLALINLWNNNTKDQNEKDLWGNIQDEVNNGWFVPSKCEWAAFGDAFSITSNNYEEYNLNDYYWSSSQSDTSHVWDARFPSGKINKNFIAYNHYVRLSITF